MQEISGTSNKVLEVDLSKKSFIVTDVSEKDLKMYMGGKGLGLKMLYDRMPARIDPLGEDNMIAFMMGVVMGTGAPCSGRFDAVTKSPLTGIMVSASCGGPFGMALKTSGWDGLIVKGKSDKPVLLYIDSKGVEFRDAKKIWGMDTHEVQAELDKLGSGSVVIGPAGENLVRYANICSGHRFLGRGGMGAVMGSKNLKAVVAKGKEYKIVPKNQKKFTKTRKRLLTYINANKVSGNQYRNLGTNSHVMLSNNAGILPVRNFTTGSHGEAHKVSAEEVLTKFNATKATCKPCAILCGHKATFEGKERIVPEFETMGLFGPNLEIFDPVIISQWNETCSLMGMDTISAAGTIAWTMEATEKGLFKSDLKFGSPDHIDRTIKDIAMGRGIGKELAMGSKWLSRKYGGEDFAMHVKGLELAAYDPRGAFGQGLAFAVANRGACHLSAAFFALEAYLNMYAPYTTWGKATYTAFAEECFNVANSLHICQFTAFPVFLQPPLIRVLPTITLKISLSAMSPIAIKVMDLSIWSRLWSSITGHRLNMWQMLKIGRRMHVLERYMNTREGISKKDDTLPGRLLKEGRKNDPKGRTVPLEKMLPKYYSVRGYDKNGIPKDRTLKKLGIEKK
ncbi:MAG TPA: aldehyde ferredoxin oxidoreductase family protein [Spirochaetota bacterium]|nr:aldehyde ferredoxin oxidoreductase family protein [Spirochaetota bacterium]HPI89310.1 aldehyde ferredoxin oxidoreductase family protein [Spirochaetota bacterium]HPR48547.1 aldehyde ferredoxin oxidoreductase family protein [Spirochaetota bacterium]